jgi:hypothetical protein
MPLSSRRPAFMVQDLVLHDADRTDPVRAEAPALIVISRAARARSETRAPTWGRANAGTRSRPDAALGRLRTIALNNDKADAAKLPASYPRVLELIGGHRTVASGRIADRNPVAPDPAEHHEMILAIGVDRNDDRRPFDQVLELELAISDAHGAARIDVLLERSPAAPASAQDCPAPHPSNKCASDV